MSKGEDAIEKILNNLKIQFKREVTLAGLTNEIGTSLPVDFVVNVDKKLAMIEYNGQQHYKPIMDQIETFNGCVRNDIARVDYATTTGMPLLVIHYKDLSKIETIIKMFINEVKSNCKKKRQYTASSIGYFTHASIERPKTEDIFVSTIAQHEPVNPVDAQTPFPITANAEFGFVQVGSGEAGAIIWTNEQMNKFTTDLKREKAQIEAIKLKNKELITKLAMSTNQLLNLKTENTKLQIQVDEIEEEKGKLQVEISELKQHLKDKESGEQAVVLGKGKIITQRIPFPSEVRKSNNRTFTETFKIYVRDMQIEYELTLDEMKEYLAYFDVSISDATLRKIIV